MSHSRLAVLAALLLPLLARADATVIFEQADTPGAQTERLPMVIANDRLRFEPGRGQASYLIFDAQSQSMTVVDGRTASYYVMDKGTAGALTERMTQMQAQAMAQMEQQLAMMPPEQAARVRQMMGQSMAAPSGANPQRPVPRQVTTGRQAQVGGQRCRVVEIYEGEQKKAELCVVTRRALGISAADLATLEAFQRFMQAMADQSSGKNQTGIFFGAAGEDAFPVQIITDAPGGAHTLRLVEISTDPVDPLLLAVPAGYREQSMGPPPGLR